MATPNGKININVGFSVDKSGLNEMQSYFQRIVNKAAEPGKELDAGLQRAGKTASQLDTILEKTFNTDLGTLNVTKFNQELNKSGLNLKTIKNDFSAVGRDGATAYNRLAQAILGTNLQLKESNKLLDSMAKTMFNTVKWGITSSLFNNITNSIEKAVDYTKHLDTSLNDIRIVTEKSAESMERFAKQANAGAKALGSSTLDYTDASLIYYQQGLEENEVQARAETTLKAANVTGQRSEEVSEQLTAVWNGYKVTAEETELYVDKLAAVAAATAADLEELSKGMSKVASAANTMGVDVDQLNAQLATIISVTKQAPEAVGTSLKTVYARLGDLKIDGVDEFGVTLGDVSSQMETVGIQILDQNGDLRDMGQVMEEVAEKWETWTSAQKQAVAVAMAGKRQYNNLMALFENWDMYTESLETSANSMGTLQKQQDIYMESTAAKLQKLRTTWQGLYDDMIETDEINNLYDTISNIVQVFDNFVTSFGGGTKTLIGFSTILANVFSKQIVNGINDAINRQEVYKNNLNNILLKQQAMAEKASKTKNMMPYDLAVAKNVEIQAEYAQKIYDLRHGLNTEQYNTLTNLQKEVGFYEEEIALQKELITTQERRALNRTDDKDHPERQKKNVADFLLSGTLDEINAIENENKKILQLEEEKLERRKSNVEIVQKELSLMNGLAKAIGEGEERTQNEAEKIEIVNERIKKIRSQLKNLTPENKKIVEDILKQVEGAEKLSDKLLLIRRNTSNINQVMRDSVAIQEKIVQREKDIQKVQEKIAEIRRNIAQYQEKRNNAQQQIDGYLKMATSAQAVFQNITKMTSAMGTFAMAFSGIQSIIEVVTDDTTNLTDKFVQLSTTGMIAFPMLIDSFKKFGEAVGVSSSLIDVLNTKRALAIANEEKEMAAIAETVTMQELKNNSEVMAVSAIDQRLVASSAITGAMTEEQIQTELLNAAKLEGIELDQLEIGESARIQAAVMARIQARRAETEAIEAETVANNARNASMLANPAMWVIAGIMATGIAIGALVKLHEKHIQKLNETAAASKKVADETSAEAKSHAELIANFEKLRKEYNQGKIGKEELYDVTNKLIESYGLESNYINQLTGDYNGLADAIKRASSKEDQKVLEQNKIALEDATQAVWEEAPKLNFSGAYIPTEETLSSYMGGLDEEQLKAIKKGTKEIFGEDFNGGEFYIDTSSAAAMSESIDKLIQLHDLYRSQGIAEDNGIVSQISEVIKAWTDLGSWDEMEGLLESRLENVIDLSHLDWATTQEEFDRRVKMLRYQLQKEIEAGLINLDLEDIDSEIAKRVSKMDSQFSKGFLVETDIKEKFKNISQEVIDEFKKYSTDVQIKAFQIGGNLDKKDIEEIHQLLEDAQTLVESDPSYTLSIPVNFQLELNDKILKSQDISKEDWKQIEESNPNASEILGDRETFNNKSIGERMALMEQLNELTKANNILNIQNYDELEKASKRRLEDIEKEVSAKEEELKLLSGEEGRIEQLKGAIVAAEAVSINGSTEEVREHAKKQLDSYTRQLETAEEEATELSNEIQSLESEKHTIEIELDMEHTTDQILQSMVGDVVTKADQLRAATESIGEGWRVAAENVSTFASAFPDLMDNVERLEDGSIQLDEEIVNSAIERNQEIIQSDKEVVLESITNKIKQLKAEKAFQEAKIEALTEYLESEATSEEAENKLIASMRKATADYENTLEENKVITNTDATNEIINNSEEGAEGVINSLKQVNEVIKTIHSNYANMLIKDVNMDEIEGIVASANKATNNFSATSNYNYEGDRDEKKAAIEAAKAELAAARARSSAIDKEIASYEGFYSDIMNRVDKANKSAERVKEGKSGKSDKSEKEKKKLDDEFDRYWEIKKAIDAVDRALNKLAKDQENLYGDELADSLMKTNELLEQQAANYARLAEEQKKEAAELQGVLGGMGVTFDASGAITNYAAATTAALAQYNEAIAKYNAGLIDEASFKIYETQYELFKKQLERYDQLFYTEMKETQEKLEEIERQKKANNLKAWQVKLEVKLEMKELKREWNDFLNEINSDFKSVYKDLRVEVENMKKNAKTYGGKDGTIMTEINAIKHVEKEIDKMKGGGVSKEYESISQAQEELKKLNEKLITDAKAFHDLVVQAWQAYLEGIDQVKDQLDYIVDRYEKINDNLTYQKQLVELLYGPEAFKMMDSYYKAAIHNSLGQIDAVKQQRDMWKEQFEEALKRNNASMNDMSTWTEDMKKAYDNWQEAQSSLNDLVVAHIQLLKDEYANTVKKTIKELEKALTGSTLKDVQEDWERATAAADKYKDEVEKVYELQTYANKIDKAINETDNIKAQQKLAKLRDQEIKDLQEKKKLTQYDLDAANARLEIAMKEIALEEAQENKSSMKVVRNEEGNWSYQYVADQEDIEQKQQDLLDSYNELYELAKSAYEENLNSAMELQEVYLQKMEEIALDETLTEEQKQQKLGELRTWYEEQYTALAEENELYRQDMMEAGTMLQLTAYEQDHEVYGELTKEKKDMFEDMITNGWSNNLEDFHIAWKTNSEDMTSEMKTALDNIKKNFNDTMSETLPIWTSAAQDIIELWNKDGGSSVKTAITKAYESIKDANDKYITSIKDLEKTAGVSFSNLEKQIEKNIDATNDLDGAMEDACNNGEQYIEQLRKAAEELEEAWNQVKDAIEDAIRELEEYLRIRGQAGSSGTDGLTPSSGSGSGSASSGSGGKSGDGNSPSSSEGSHFRIVGGGRTLGSGYTSESAAQNAKKAGIKKWEPKYDDKGFKINQSPEQAAEYRAWLNSIIEKYRSGGYTGSWPGANIEENGRLAMLHQKELVLNADDTKNMLDAIGIVRALSSFISATTAGLAAAPAPSVSSNIANSSNSYGDVIIQADFPNANDVTEIREAILSLPNLAAQYFAQNRR